jgi:Fe-S-cluster-containing hydrogenase component 2
MPRKWIEDKCVLCSLCVALCPYEAFKKVDGKIQVDITKCVNCEECLPIIGCPRRAIR